MEILQNSFKVVVKDWKYFAIFANGNGFVRQISWLHLFTKTNNQAIVKAKAHLQQTVVHKFLQLKKHQWEQVWFTFQFKLLDFFKHKSYAPQSIT